MKKLEKLSLRSKLTVLALQALAALLMTTQRVWAQQSYNSGNVSQWIEVNSWQQLCVGLATGGNIRLMSTVTAPSLSTPEYNYFTDFSVPRGKTVTLDLT